MVPDIELVVPVGEGEGNYGTEIELVVLMGEREGNDGTSFMDDLPRSVDMSMASMARVYT